MVNKSSNAYYILYQYIRKYIKKNTIFTNVLNLTYEYQYYNGVLLPPPLQIGCV